MIITYWIEKPFFANQDMFSIEYSFANGNGEVFPCSCYGICPKHKGMSGLKRSVKRYLSFLPETEFTFIKKEN